MKLPIYPPPKKKTQKRTFLGWISGDLTAGIRRKDVGIRMNSRGPINMMGVGDSSQNAQVKYTVSLFR
jgi:hypothetical protein